MNDEIILPSPETTLVVLLGASEFPEAEDFEPSEAFARSADGLRQYFLNNFGLPRKNIWDRFDDRSSSLELQKGIVEFLSNRIASQIIKDVLVYFVGHGGFDLDGDYHLLIRSSQEPGLLASKLRMKDLADVIKQNASTLSKQDC